MQFSFRPRAARQLALVAGALSIASLVSSCNKGAEFVKSKSGFEYKIFKKVNGKYEPRTVTTTEDPTYKDRTGKFLLAHLEYRTGKDSVLQSSRKQLMNHAVPLPLQPVMKKGGQEEAMSMLQAGDSAIFRFKTDSLFKGGVVPPELKRGGGVLVMQIVVEKIIDQSQETALEQELRPVMQQAQERMQAEQLKKDDVAIQDYLKKNNLTAAQKTPTGVYYLVTQPGTGAKPTPGQTVSVQYTGMLLNGKVFDSSAKQGKPIEFPVGQGAVIPGWDQALLLLNKGSKATLVIPSTLAYGKRSPGAEIPADSPLRFDVELVDVKNTPTPPAPPAGAMPGGMPGAGVPPTR